jgi:phage tail protein X
VVLIVDEAQDLSVEALGHFRYLNNLETPETKLIQIVLVGTNELDTTLRDERLLSLRQRISIRHVIKPLDPRLATEYIFHRVRIAGNSAKNLFTVGALWHIVNYARGIPRLINVVCDNSLVLSFALSKVPVEETSVREVLQDLEGGQSVSEIQEIISREEFDPLYHAVSRRMKETLQGSESLSPIEPPRSAQEEAGQDTDRLDQMGSSPTALDEGGTDGERVHPIAGLEPSFRPRQRHVLIAAGILFSIIVLGILVIFGLLRKNTLDHENPSAPYTHEHAETQIPPLKESGEAGLKEIPQKQKEISETDLKEVPLKQGDASKTHVKEIPQEHQSTKEKTIVFNNKGIGAIALEHYGRLNRKILTMLRDANLHIQDWNRLGPSVELTLPDIPSVAQSGVDFYTVQVATYKSGLPTHKLVDALSREGIQNIFIIREDSPGRKGKGWTYICTGVFETMDESLEWIKSMQELGFPDAFPTRLQGKQLGDILQPHPASLPKPHSPEQ